MTGFLASGDVVAYIVMATAAALSAGAAGAVLERAACLSGGEVAAPEPFQAWQQVC